MKKLSLEGLNFSTTEINIKNKIMTITLDRPEKKNAMNNVMMNEKFKPSKESFFIL